MATKATATLEKEIIETLTSEPTENEPKMSTTKQASKREKALEEAIAQIERNYGRGAVMLMSENDSFRNVDAISTGSLSLDIALGIGGLPRGRIIEIFGTESAGKSTLAMSAVAQAQKAGGVCAYVDVEHAMDPIYAKAIGVDIDSLLISQPDSAEQALEIIEHLVRSGALDMIVLDSVAALVPNAEIQGNMGDFQIGAQARLMSQALRKLTAIVNQTKTICVFINQLREKVGVVYGSPEVTPGGRALKFYSSVRLDMRRKESLKTGKDITGNRVRVRVVKNKVAPPFRQAEIDIIFNEGISIEGDLLELGVEHGILQKRGAFYAYGETRLGQGREASRIFLKEHTDMRDEIDAQVRGITMPDTQKA
ncbi:Protein RecA [Geodia barretti]|uniref:Protein RecA n=1 Tax=Geodia barretti TaxID=519541 RepID=A0AA35W6Z3_GEOBA|nr:Protein RecA [Geodia barretti]